MFLDTGHIEILLGRVVVSFVVDGEVTFLPFGSQLQYQPCGGFLLSQGELVGELGHRKCSSHAPNLEQYGRINLIKQLLRYHCLLMRPDGRFLGGLRVGRGFKFKLF